MTSELRAHLPQAYVWIWLPGAVDPVVAGAVRPRGDLMVFNGRSYLTRGCDPALSAEAAADEWTARTARRTHHPRLPGRCAPRRLTERGFDDADPTGPSPLTYMLHSDSDRIGALDFQPSPETFEPRRAGEATLEELMQAAESVDQGLPLPASLERALLHGASVGGARPKAALRDGNRSLIAKFSSSTDPYPLVKGEFVAMELAGRAGLAVADMELERVLGRDVLLVERFDREAADGVVRRRSVVSALTMLELDEIAARYASYAELAQIVRERFADPARTLRELFARITFNVLVGNTDDHARNHAAFWDGRMLTLTPAYDICPQPRSGGEASQAMAIGPDGFRMSQLTGCIEAASA